MNPEISPDEHLRSQEIYAQLSDQERVNADTFEAGLSRSKEYMFELANSLLDAYPERQWDVIIGDDTSGRLPTRFIRKALDAQGVDLPVSYIMAGSEARRSVPIETYQGYVEQLRPQDGSQLRPLIVTESAGTYRTTRFIRDLLEPMSEEVDLAVVGPATVATDFDAIYVGGVGKEPNSAVMDTFEVTKSTDLHSKIAEFVRRYTPARLRTAVKNLTGGAVNSLRPASESGRLTNLDNTPGELPVASISENTEYRGLASYCYTRMDELAAEFSKQRQVYELERIADENAG